ncbi:MAG: SpoIIE family protein phosphatase [Candidatus Competibacter sp.]|nr:SpoIIE family protein phosphatase [Candidatus Competibacter sp.]MDG4584496.1 SpoIIE family protein phosphatase [Candidatus Competibacter sp.]
MSEQRPPRPRFAGLKRQFLLLLGGIYLLACMAALLLFAVVVDGIIRQLGEDFATQFVLRQKDRILAPIQREVALSRALADSPLLKQWARAEVDPALQAQALAELDNYRRHFADRSYFFVVNASGHYYHNNAADEYRGRELRFTVDPTLPRDRWYFATMTRVDDLALNVDYDAPLDVTKVWINAVVKEGDIKLGLGGTGLELDTFIQAVLGEDREGVVTLLLDRTGAIKAYRDRSYIDFNTVAKDSAEHSTLYRLLASPEEQAGLRAHLEQLAVGRAPVATLDLTVEGQPYLAAMAYLPDIQWFAVVLVDIAHVYSLWRFAPLALLLLASLLLLAVAMTVLLDRLVLGPLARLHRSTQAIAAGDYGQLAAVESGNEIGGLTHAFNDMALKMRRYTDRLEQLVEERTRALTRSNRQLAETHEQVLDSIRYALLIQQAILPRSELLERVLDEYFVIWKPRDLVGGDFYFCRVDEWGCLLAVADCTGHGVPGAFMTMAVSAVLNHVTSALCVDDPARILQETNRQLRATLRQDDMGEGFENGLDAAVCYWAWSERQLRFAGARIDLVCQDSDGTLTVVRGDGHSLGYRDADFEREFARHRIERISGRVFYLSTDGLLDQAGGEKGYGFGRRRFYEALRAGDGQPLAARGALLEQALASYQDGRPQRDDITVFGFRPAMQPLEPFLKES